MTVSRTLGLGTALALALSAVPARPVAAQDVTDKLTWHASLNAGLARSDELPALGIPIKGTSDYRVFTLQTRYKLSEKDEFVAQFLNRRFGSSPLAAAINDVTAQWAYWNHKFDLGSARGAFKAGRTPITRGLLNEVRYIGSVLPFYRPSLEVYSDAFDALDGAIVTLSHPLGSASVEANAFFGGSDWRSVVTTATGLDPRIQRMENMFGSQLYLDVPFAGLRLGAYGARMEVRTPTTKGYMTNTILSAQSQFDRLTLRAEQSNLNGHGPARDNHHKYFQGVVRVTDKVQVAGESTISNSRLFFAANAPLLRAVLPSVRSQGASLMYDLAPGTLLKLEHHWRAGYVYDVNVAPIQSQTSTVVVLNPNRSTRYVIASIATTF